VHSFGVAPGGNDECGGGLRVDTPSGEQGRFGLGAQIDDRGVELVDLSAEIDMTPSQATSGPPGRLERLSPGAGPEAGADSDPLAGVEMPQTGPHLVRRGHDQVSDLIRRRGPGF